MEYLTDDMITSTIRLSLIVLLSGLIGIEREMKNHPAGLRTHILVGVGSCLLMLVSLFGFESYISTHSEYVRYDPSRIPSYVISGIGFLGAGTILVHRGITVKGLTTAASIWIVAGLGLVVGIGMYFEAILTTIIIISTLFFLNKLEEYYKGKSKNKNLILITLFVKKQNDILTFINDKIKAKGFEITQLNIEEQDNQDTEKFSIVVKPIKNEDPFFLVEELKNLQFVNKAKLKSYNSE